MWIRLSDPLYKQLDVVGTRAPLLLVKVPAIPAWSDDDPWPRRLHAVRPVSGSGKRRDGDPFGGGVWGGAGCLVARGGPPVSSPRQPGRRARRCFRSRSGRGRRWTICGSQKVPLIALDTSGPELSEAPFPDTFGLVVGVEGPGLPGHLRQGERRRIAIEPGVESLNAATATAIALYVWARRRRPDLAGADIGGSEIAKTMVPKMPVL